jgi:tagatose-1,6-bisphosphate aldolase
MARYNSVSTTGSIAQGGTISSPYSGLLTTITTGSGTTNLPNPVLYAGSSQTFYNATVAAITLLTPSGVFTGPATGGATTLTLPAGSINILYE